jgi:uncharacterized protein (DUF1800 family)
MTKGKICSSVSTMMLVGRLGYDQYELIYTKGISVQTRRQLFSFFFRKKPAYSNASLLKPRVKPAKKPALIVNSLLATPAPDDASLGAVDPLVILLNRCTFGIKESEYQRALSLGYSGWLQEQLNYTALDVAALDSEIATLFPRTTWTTAQLTADANTTNVPGQAARDLVSATTLRQLYSPRQLYEVMVEFWTNHFNVATLTTPERYLKPVDDREVARANALGSFPAMLAASARSLAMQYYLDNVSNTRTGPNENYARELMELHTLGVNGGYTEADVKEVARCFTGWTVINLNTNAPEFSFVATRHDTGAKSVLGTAIPAGRGIEDGNQVLDILAKHPSTAAYIARKLCVRFIGDVPEPTIVSQVAATYTNTNGNITEMLKTLFASAEFMASHDRKVRRPQEFVIGTLRVLEPTFTTDYLAKALGPVTAMGQVPFQWPAPNGYPDVSAYWVNTGSSLTRWNWAFGLAEDTLGVSIRIDIPALISTANTPTALVDRLSARLLRRTLNSADRTRIINFTARGGSVTQVLSGTDLTFRSRELIGLLLSSPYFQYR